MPVSEATYKRVALEDPDGKWELYCGELRSKPAMTWEHTDTYSYLSFMLQSQLSREEYYVHINGSRVRRSESQYFIPDLVVIPAASGERFRRQRRTLEVYPEPLPLVVEVWSPSTGRYDAREKLPEYRQRGDLEIWLIHPYDRTLTAWRRGPDGDYTEHLYTGGEVRPAALPGVVIDLDQLFA